MPSLSVLFDRAQVSPWDVVDILIVSILIYEALKLIRGTRAMQMAIGSVLVILLLYISQAFPLRTVGWLIRNVLAYVGLRRDRAVPVGHPPRACRTSGARRSFATSAGPNAPPRPSKKSSPPPACWPRRGSARSSSSSVRSDCATTSRAAFPLDAAVSYDLLTTIFQPTTPLHDGAVIISEERIAAAACFLPLTVNPKLDRDLGTRHRAAIGLTEECDAVAVVVSEERGEISLARHGNIVRGLTLDELRARLQSLLLLQRMTHNGRATARELDD